MLLYCPPHPALWCRRWLILIISFIIIQLPPGDYLTSYVAHCAQGEQGGSGADRKGLRERYGLGQPVYVQYFKWISGILLAQRRGQSLEWQKPVKELIWERLGLTIYPFRCGFAGQLVYRDPQLASIRATHQYSWLDYLLSFFSFVGLGTPGFLLVDRHVLYAVLAGYECGRAFFRGVIYFSALELGQVC